MPWIPRGLRDGIVTSPLPAPSGRLRSDVPGSGDDRRRPRRRTRLRRNEADRERCPTAAISAEGDTDPTRPGPLHPVRSLRRAVPRGLRVRPDFESRPRSPETCSSCPKRRGIDAIWRRHEREPRWTGAGTAALGARSPPRLRLGRRRGVGDRCAHEPGLRRSAPRGLTSRPARGTPISSLSPAPARRGMLGALQRTHEAMPAPKVVVAVGTDAVSGGLFGAATRPRGGVADEMPVDVFVPGLATEPLRDPARHPARRRPAAPWKRPMNGGLLLAAFSCLAPECSSTSSSRTRGAGATSPVCACSCFIGCFLAVGVQVISDGSQVLSLGNLARDRHDDDPPR